MVYLFQERYTDTLAASDDAVKQRNWFSGYAMFGAGLTTGIVNLVNFSVTFLCFNVLFLEQ